MTSKTAPTMTSPPATPEEALPRKYKKRKRRLSPTAVTVHRSYDQLLKETYGISMSGEARCSLQTMIHACILRMLKGSKTLASNVDGCKNVGSRHVLTQISLELFDDEELMGPAVIYAQEAVTRFLDSYRPEGAKRLNGALSGGIPGDLQKEDEDSDFEDDDEEDDDDDDSDDEEDSGGDDESNGET